MIWQLIYGERPTCYTRRGWARVRESETGNKNSPSLRRSAFLLH